MALNKIFLFQLINQSGSTTVISFHFLRIALCLCQNTEDFDKQRESRAAKIKSLSTVTTLMLQRYEDKGKICFPLRS